jgi:hypothetical protein
MRNPKIILAGPTYCQRRRAGRIDRVTASLRHGYQEARENLGLGPEAYDIAHAPLTWVEKLGGLAAVAALVLLAAHAWGA